MMSTTLSRPPAATGSVVGPLLPIVAVVFTAYLVVGLAMPVLPIHVHQGLGLGTFIVGLVAGSQFAASLVSRFWAGHRADSRGAKHTVVTGLVVAVVAGVLYLLSLRFTGEPDISATVLLPEQSSAAQRASSSPERWSGGCAALCRARVGPGLACVRRQGGSPFGLPRQHRDGGLRSGYRTPASDGCWRTA